MIDSLRLAFTATRFGAAAAVAGAVLFVLGCDRRPAPAPPASTPPPATAPEAPPPPIDPPATPPGAATEPAANTAPVNPPEGAVTAPAGASKQRNLTGTFPDDWFFKDPADKTAWRRPVESQDLEEKKPPPLTVTSWIGSEPIDLADLEGKIVVVHFWASHRPRPMRQVPQNIMLAEAYRDQDVVFIGVHETAPSAATLDSAYEVHELNYPVCVDVDGQTVKDWRVILWPHYNVIDHQGYLRASGLIPSRVDDVIDALIRLREKSRAKAAPAAG